AVASSWSRFRLETSSSLLDSTEHVSYAKNLFNRLLFDEFGACNAGAAVSGQPPGSKSVYHSSRPGSRAQALCRPVRSLSWQKRRRGTWRYSEHRPASPRQLRPRDIPRDPQRHSQPGNARHVQFSRRRGLADGRIRAAIGPARVAGACHWRPCCRRARLPEERLRVLPYHRRKRRRLGTRPFGHWRQASNTSSTRIHNCAERRYSARLSHSGGDQRNREEQQRDSSQRRRILDPFARYEWRSAVFHEE